MRAAFGLGSNMGDSPALLTRAAKTVVALPYCADDTLDTSPIYETPALLPDNAPDWWDRPFLNQIITCDIIDDVNPETVLDDVKAIEHALGRIHRGHWSPREIDIDIIVLGTLRLDSERLIIPHPRALERDFVTTPLRDIWPECWLLNEAS